jgi:hypothetical protein
MAAPFLTGSIDEIIDQRGAASTTWLERRAERQCILRIGGGVDKTADVVECALKPVDPIRNQPYTSLGACLVGDRSAMSKRIGRDARVIAERTMRSWPGG